MGPSCDVQVVSQLHRQVRGAVRHLAFQFHRTALVQGCCNSGKTTVLRTELDKFQLPYFYTKPYLNGRNETREFTAILDAFADDRIIVVDYEDAQYINPYVVQAMCSVMDQGAYVILVCDQVFDDRGNMLSAVSNHQHLQSVVNRCRVVVDHSAVIENWKKVLVP
jgi:hypothetical protein